MGKCIGNGKRLDHLIAPFFVGDPLSSNARLLGRL
jgi:hypothetical protein